MDLKPEVAGDLREGPGAVGKVAYEVFKDWGQRRNHDDVCLRTSLLIKEQYPFRVRFIVGVAESEI